MLTPLDIVESLPLSVRNFTLDIVIRLQQYRNKNIVIEDCLGTSIKFGYWDVKTFYKAHDMIQDGRINHERIPFHHFDLENGRFDAALDIGAYFGVYSIIFAALNDDFPIHAFEPQTYNFDVLEQNMLLNNISDGRVKTHKMVVCGHDGELNLYESAQPGSPSHTIRPTYKHNGYEPITVDSVTPATFCGEYGYETPFLKIDAEGAELEILDNLLENFDQPAGFIELHLNRDGITKSAFRDRLSRYDYQATEIKETYVDTNPGYLFYPAANPLSSLPK